MTTDRARDLEPEYYWVCENPQHRWVIYEPVRKGYSVSIGAFPTTIVHARDIEYVRSTGKLPPQETSDVTD